MSILCCLDNRSKRSWALVLAVVVLLVVCAAAAADDDDGEVASNEVFVPTREWQAIPRGVAIPPGLHIRIDLTTGERHAKLIDSNDQTPPSNQTAAVMVPATKSAEEVSKVDAARLTKEKVLMKLPDRELADMGLDFTKARAELSNDEYWALIEQKWEERQALIQKVYDQMLKPAEVLAELIANISTPHNTTLHGMRVALEQLEDFLTDIDMARDFYTLGGWPRLVALLGPEHHSEVRWRAAWAVGNAVKNDHIFQRWILEAHGQRDTPLTKLLAIVKEGQKAVEGEGAEVVTGDERNGAPDELLRKAVYAITSASRGNSVVQARLLQEGGMDTLASLLGAPFASLPLRVKVATFGTDMLTEVGHAVETGQDAEALEQAVTSQRWCEGSLALLHDVGHDPVSTEKVLLTLEAMKDRCEGTGHIDTGHLQETVSFLRDLYSSEGEEGDKPLLIREMERPYREELVARMDRLAGGGPVRLREEL